MTRDAWKNLSLKDFMAPHQVLCYGAGLIGQVVLDPYLQAGINVVGFIDKNKRGTVKTALSTSPIYSIDAAVETFGKNIVVIITVGNSRFYPEITADLVAAGISEQNIYDREFSSWMTVPSSKCYCKSLFGHALLLTNALAKCCFWGENRCFHAEMLDPDVPFEQLVKEYTDKTRYYYEKARMGEVPLYCSGCPHLESKPLESLPLLDSITFAPSVQCNIKCIYCVAMLETDVSKEAYDAKGYGELFLSMLSYLDRNKLIAPGGRISFAGGEISVSPKKRELLDFAADHPEYRYSFLSNCVVYDEAISDILARDPDNYVMCDLDAGTPETYYLVKGYHYFDRTVANVGKYARSGQVYLKYIVLPGINTGLEDLLGTVEILKKLGITELRLAVDHHHHPSDPYAERQTTLAIVRFMKILEENDIQYSFFEDSFNTKQVNMINRLYRQGLVSLKGDKTGA